MQQMRRALLQKAEAETEMIIMPSIVARSKGKIPVFLKPILAVLVTEVHVI